MVLFPSIQLCMLKCWLNCIHKAFRWNCNKFLAEYNTRFYSLGLDNRKYIKIINYNKIIPEWLAGLRIQDMKNEKNKK